MSKPLTERELIELQIKTYDFYAGLIDRAVGAGVGPKMPKWDEERAQEYKRLADELRARLAEMDAVSVPASATDTGAVSRESGPETSSASTRGSTSK